MSLFARIKTWVANETLKSSDVNAEFNNIISNMIPTSIVGYESTVNQMRTQTDPGSQGSESQASSMAGEIERLRFVINRALGGTYWYDNPNTSLAAIQTLLTAAIVVPQNRIVSGRIDGNDQPMFLTPDTGSNSTVKLKASVTNLTAYIKNALVTVASDLSTTLSGPSAFTCQVNVAGLTPNQSSAIAGEYGRVITIDTTSGSAPTVGTYQAWKVVHTGVTEYFTARYASSTQLDKAQRGFFFDSTDASVPRMGIADNDVITLCRIAYMFLTNVSGIPGLSVTYNEPIASYSQPSGPSTGDWWLDLSAGGIWKVFSGGTFIDGTGTLLGVAVVDGSNVVACRSNDFDRGFSNLNTFSLELADSATIKSVSQDSRISVYGNSFQFLKTTVTWANPAQLDSGVSVTTLQGYFFYVTDKGNLFISDKQPRDSSGTLLGYYHPSKPWRCVGTSDTDGSSNFTTPTNYDYLGLTAGFVDQTRLGVAPISTLSLASPTDNTNGLALSTSYQDVASGQGGSTTLTLHGRPVLISLNVLVANGDAALRTILVQVLRGSTVLRTYVKTLANAGTNGGECVICDTFMDSGGNGSTIYKVQAKMNSGTTVSLYPPGISAAAGATTLSMFGRLAGTATALNGTTTGLRAIEAIEL